MKALVLKKYNKLSWEDVPVPKITPEEVLVRVKACGICGSDVHGMDGSTGRRIPPLIMGHEAAGVIAQLGAKVWDWQVDDRVTFDSTIYRLDNEYTRKGFYNLSDGRMVLGVSCGEYRRDGAFAEYVAVPQHILYRIPDKVTFTQAAMVEPVAVALHAVSVTPIAVNDTAVVIGSGMIGLFLIQALRIAGCGKIIAVDVKPERLQLAKQLGADFGIPVDDDLIAKVKKSTNGRGADIGFDAVGIESSVTAAINCVHRGATVTLIGNLAASVNLPLQKVVTQQIRLQGSCAVCGEYPAVLDMIERGKINVDAILSTQAPMAEGAEWFKRLYDKEQGVLKVVLVP
ncbi:MAG: zinc-binding dehydrogenase [Actinobacteria bacterium]|nr:zinc-binding dehydrogenase [Actinomycetota bacterium]